VKSHSIYPAAILALVLSAAVQAQNPESPGSKEQPHPGHAESAAGQPGKPEDATRTIEIKTLDRMKYDPASLTLNRGEIVRLVVTNTGRLRHEATIGSAAEQQAHAAEMKAAPDISHDSPNSVIVEPGQTKELIWRFDQPGRFEIGCHIPGHYQAGMIAEVIVR